MFVAIISDVHNNTTNLKKVLDYCSKEKIGTIICCGDLASMETLDFLNDNYSGKIYYCFGNMDDDQMKNFEFGDHVKSDEVSDHVARKYKNTWIFRNFGEAEFGSEASKKYKIAFAHYPEAAKELGETGKYSYVFYGHTHKPWAEKISDCIMLNPGNVAGELYPPTFAIWETEEGIYYLVKINELKNGDQTGTA